MESEKKTKAAVLPIAGIGQLNVDIVMQQKGFVSYPVGRNRAFKRL